MQVKLTSSGEIQFLDGDHINRNSLNRKTLIVMPETALATRESLWVQFGDNQNFEDVNANILEPIRLSEEEDGYKTIFPDELVKRAGVWYMTLAVRMYSTDGTTFSEQLTSDKVSFTVNDSFPLNDGGYASNGTIENIWQDVKEDAQATENAANEAVQSATAAEQSATQAMQSASAAQSSATAAAQSASNATGSATQARQYATAAEGHANAASGSAEQAASSATAAAGSATAAGQSASAAAQSATQAEQNASAAATSAGQAAQSASAAQASADRAQQIVDGIGDVYTPVGSIPYAQLPATPSQAERGYVYNITDSFTTDSRFVEGAGLQYAAGTNVAVVLNGSQYMYDVLGGMVDLSNYAQINGTYPNMSVGKATSDGDGNNIAATYTKQSGTYPNLTAGSAQKVAPAGLINSGTEGWWKFLQVQYSGGSAGLEAVLNEVFLVNGLLDYFESSDTYTEAAALLQLKAVYLPQTNAWKEYSLVYLDGDMPYTRFCVYADAEGLHVSQYGTQSEMNLVPLSSKSSGFTVSYVGGPETPPEERKEPEVLLPMLNGTTRVYTYNGSDFTAQAGDSYIIDEPNIVSGGNTLAVGDLVQDSSGTILRLTTVNDGSGLAIGTVLGRHIPYYLKPGTGIPKSHLAQAVQTSLGKADTALQSAPVTSVAGKTGAVTLAKGDVGLSNVDNVRQYSASNPPPYPVSSVNGKTGAVTLSAADVKAATTTQVNETSMVPDSGNATNLTVPESGGRVEIEADGWLCVSISKTTANGQFVTMVVQKEDGTDKWGCVNKSTTYFQNNYPAEFLPVKKGDYVRISYNITPSRIQLIRAKQV